jgi:hypothetical protein
MAVRSRKAMPADSKVAARLLRPMLGLLGSNAAVFILTAPAFYE